MDEWGSAAMEGPLRWTSPALPDGGERLHSVLSPTLLLGYPEKGGQKRKLAVDYVTLSGIKKISNPSHNAIEITRDDAPKPLLLVCEDPSSTTAWLNAFRKACPHADVPAGGGGRDAEPAPASPYAVASTSAATPAAASAPEATDDRWLHNAYDKLNQLLADDMQKVGMASPAGRRETPPTPASVRPPSPPPTGSHQHNMEVSYGTRGVPRPPASSGFGQDQAASPRPIPRTVEGPADDTAPSPPRAPMYSEDPNPKPLSALAAAASPRPLPTASSPRPMPVEQPARPPSTPPMDQRPVQHANDPQQSSSYETMAPSMSPNPAVPSSQWGVRRWEVPCPADSKGHHEFRQFPARTTTTTANLPDGEKISTTTVTEQGETFRAAPPGDTFRAAPSVETSRAPHKTLSQHAASVQRSGSTNPFLGGGAPTPATHSRRGKSGQFISMPTTAQVNANTAPNVSAMWKEWSAPDGTFYVHHEPTGTVQRRLPGSAEFETMAGDGEDLNPEDIALRPYSPDAATAVNLNSQTVFNTQLYGSGGQDLSTTTRWNTVKGRNEMPSPSRLRSVDGNTMREGSPRGQYSPTGHTQLLPTGQPRPSTRYDGKRHHVLTLEPGEDEKAGDSVVKHRVQSLGSRHLVLDPNGGGVANAQGGQSAMTLLQAQWEYIRKILHQGRYYKKHSINTNSSGFRFVFLTADNSHVCSVPTSTVTMFSMRPDPRNTGIEGVQYHPSDVKSLALDDVTHVSMGYEEPFAMRREGLNPNCTFCIVGKMTALVLECNSQKEAEFFCDAWNFFFTYSSTKPQPVPPSAIFPVSHGTRSGIGF